MVQPLKDKLALVTGATRDEAVLSELAAATGRPERGRSTYWEIETAKFEVSVDGRIDGEVVLGNISRKTGPLYTAAHWILQWPFRRVGARYRSFSRCLRAARVVAARTGRQLTEDMIRQALGLALSLDLVEHDTAGRATAIIGDGFGVMTSLVLAVLPDRKVIVVNLVKSLLADMVFLRQAAPDAGMALVHDLDEMKQALDSPEISIIAVMADDARLLARAPIGLAINTHSMQEMTAPVIAEYFDLLRKAPAEKTAFYCCNKLVKRLPGGFENKFMEYPWRTTDGSLVDEEAPWSRITYSARPPFWRRRQGDPIWHRLVWLEKEPGA